MTERPNRIKYSLAGLVLAVGWGRSASDFTFPAEQARQRRFLWGRLLLFRLQARQQWNRHGALVGLRRNDGWDCDRDRHPTRLIRVRRARRALTVVVGRVMVMGNIVLSDRVRIVGVELVAVQAWAVVGLELLELGRTLTLELTFLKLTLVAHRPALLGKLLGTQRPFGGILVRKGCGRAIGVHEHGSDGCRLCVVSVVGIRSVRLRHLVVSVLVVHETTAMSMPTMSSRGSLVYRSVNNTINPAGNKLT